MNTEISFHPLPPPAVALLLMALVWLFVLRLDADGPTTLSTFTAGASCAATVDVPLLSGSPSLGNATLGGPANSVPPWRIVVLMILG